MIIMRPGLGAASPGSVLIDLQQGLSAADSSQHYFSALILSERVARLTLAIPDSVQDYIVTQSSGNHAQAFASLPKIQ